MVTTFVNFLIFITSESLRTIQDGQLPGLHTTFPPSASTVDVWSNFVNVQRQAVITQNSSWLYTRLKFLHRLSMFKNIPKHYAAMSRDDEYQTVQPRAVCSYVHNRYTVGLSVNMCVLREVVWTKMTVRKYSFPPSVTTLPVPMR